VLVQEVAVENEEEREGEETSQTQGNSITLPFAGQRTLPHHDAPPPAAPGKRIHPRRPLPPIPEGEPEPKE
jgi:hypothetical protein